MNRFKCLSSIITCLVGFIYFAISVDGSAQTQNPSQLIFSLESVRSQSVLGPFRFRTGYLMKTGSGVFKLQVLANRTFKAKGVVTGKSYGVYELILGRIIELGDAMFTITDIKYTKTTTSRQNKKTAYRRSSSTRKRSVLPATSSTITVGIEYKPFSSTFYDWKIKGAESGTSTSIDRQSVAVLFSKGKLFCRAGVITEAEWDETVSGSVGSYQNVEITDGSGWWISLGGKYPLFNEGRWRADVDGAVSYRKEKFSLKYGSSHLASVTQTLSTNSTSVVTTNIVNNYEFTPYERDADLTEILLSVGASLTYETPSWWMYAGLSAEPFSDTDFSSSVSTGDGSNYDVEFERTHPVNAYIGAGRIMLGFRFYLQGRVGSENAVRMGIERRF